MNDKGMTVFLVIDSLILFALIVIKSVFFYKAARKKTIKRWFYFSTYEVEDAPSDNIKQLRKKNNAYTMAILVAIILSAIIGFFILANGD